jgi:hypothetical protein
MNNKATVYTVLAVMVGYLLISAVPGQLERYVAPRPEMLMGPGETVDERTFGEPGENVNATEDAKAFTLGEQGAEGVSGELDVSVMEGGGIASYMDLYTWWALDLGAAFSIYWLARRRFS